MDTTFADPETNQLLSLVRQFERICANQMLNEPKEPNSDRPTIEIMFDELFNKIYDILGRLQNASSNGRQIITEFSFINSDFDSSTTVDLLELLARVRTNVTVERKKANDVIDFLRTRIPMPPNTSCDALMEKLKNLEALYTMLKTQLSNANCELQVKNEQLADKENEIIELSQRLVQCCTALEAAKSDLICAENNLKRQVAEAADAKAKCTELKKYSDLAVEQTTSVIHERDQSQKLVEHLQSRISALDQENCILVSRLNETEKLYAEVANAHSALSDEFKRLAEKDRVTEANVEKIMQECSERVQIEADRVKDIYQRDLDSCKSEIHRLELELTEWKLKYDQLQRDYRNVDVMFEKFNADVSRTSQNDALEKAEAIRRAAAAECARDEALFVKQQLSLKIEKLELALAKLSERCTNDIHAKQARIGDLQRQVTSLTEENARSIQEKSDLERELIEARERYIDLEIQYRFKIKSAEEDARTTMLACDAKMSTADEGHRKLINDLSRELNARQSVINKLLDDKKRRCGEVEEHLENVQQQLQEEQSRNRELSRVRAEQARRIAALEDQISQTQRSAEGFKRALITKQ